MSIRSFIPNAITSVNLLGGCMASWFAFHHGEVFAGHPAWLWATVCIAISTVADFLDGFSARMLHAYSLVGKELDSLSDLVSFGVAPAMLMLNIISGGNPQAWYAWAALLIPVAGALRLARFNVDNRQKTSFIGLPIPANAIFWLGYAAVLATGSFAWLASPWVWLPVLAIESWLMISPIPLFSLKFNNYALQPNLRRYLLLFCSAGLLCWLGLPALLPIILLYLLLNIRFK